MKKILALILTVFLMAPVTVEAKKKKRSKRRAPSGFIEERKNKLNLQGGTVEGITKKRNRFGANINKRKRKKRAHLYNEYISFEEEMDQTVREMRQTR